MTRDDRTRFLEYVKENQGCTVGVACRAVGLRRRDVKALRAKDPDFLDEYRTAQGYGNEQIFHASKIVAVDGVEEPVVSAGKLVHYPEGHPRAGEIVTVLRRDTRMLQTLFTAITPEGKATMGRKLGIEVTGEGGGPIRVQRGVELSEVLKVLEAAGVAGALEEAPPGTGEVIAESDEPA